MEENKDLQEKPEEASEEPALEETAIEAVEADEPDKADETEPATETATEEDGEEDGEEDDNFEKLFSVPFNINVDELYHFQLSMARAQIEKNKKRSKIISIVEIALGVIYLGSIMAGMVMNGPLQYALTLALIALGVYGLLYYKYFFEKSLRRNVEKQHGKIPYFNSEIVMDIYPNKCVECFQDRETPNYWHKIQGVISSSDAYYIQLDAKRCLLIPKRCAGSQLEPFLRKMCDDFEKRWTETD